MADLRDRLDSYLQEAARVALRERTDAMEPSERAAARAELDDRFGDLTSGDLLDGLRSDRESATLDSTRENLARLIFALESAVLVASTRGLDAEIFEREFRGADPPELRELREERFARRGSARAELGHSTARARFGSRHPSVDLEAWRRAAELFLESTEAVYRDALDLALPEAGADPAIARREDLLRVARRANFDRYFPASRWQDCLDFTTQGMGIRVGETPGVGVYAELGAGALCGALEVPGDIRLVVGTRAGADNYEAIFDAFGRALPRAYTSSSLPLECRQIGDPALDVAWGAWLSDRLHDADWIERGPAAPRALPFSNAANLLWLSRRRRASALLPVEIDLAALGPEGDPRATSEFYADSLSHSLGYPHASGAALVDASPELLALHELRGACLVAQLDDHLRREFGARFWENRRAGDLLKELWNTGTTYDAEGIADQLGLGALSIDFLIETTQRRT